MILLSDVISVALQKGGTGKTTTALNVAAILKEMGKRVLLVDLDSQMNATIASAIKFEKTIINCFNGEISAQRAIVRGEYYDLLPGSEFLVNVERSEDLDYALLKNLLKYEKQNYDYFILDTPPALGNCLKLALMASDWVLIPAEARQFSIQGLQAFWPTIQDIVAVNQKLKILGILLTRYDGRRVLNRQLYEYVTEVAQDMGTEMFKNTIRDSITVAESHTMRKPLIVYAPKAKVTDDYRKTVQEILERMG